jgi:hypothetical protein
MKLNELLSEQVLAFPSKDRNRKVQMDRLRKRSSMYDELTGEPIGNHPDKRQKYYFVVDQDGKAHAQFDTPQQAKKAIPRLELKSGKRGLTVTPA